MLRPKGANLPQLDLNLQKRLGLAPVPPIGKECCANSPKRTGPFDPI